MRAGAPVQPKRAGHPGRTKQLQEQQLQEQQAQELIATGYLYRWPGGQPVIELMEGATAGTPNVGEDGLALNFARAFSLTGGDAYALALYERVVAERTERLGPTHVDTRDAAAALLAGIVLAQAPTDSAVQRAPG